MPTAQQGYTLHGFQDGTSVLRPEPFARKSGAGHWRTAATPRSRRADFARLAKANGWSDATMEAKLCAHLAKTGGSDVYVPTTKKAKWNYAKLQQARNPLNVQADFMSGRTDGDYVAEAERKRVRRRDVLRNAVMDALLCGALKWDDAPEWAQRRAANIIGPLV